MLVCIVQCICDNIHIDRYIIVGYTNNLRRMYKIYTCIRYSSYKLIVILGTVFKLETHSYFKKVYSILQSRVTKILFRFINSWKGVFVYVYIH